MDSPIRASPRLSHIRIVLVEPAGPLNVGSVARVMKNFGLGPLVLVRPRCDRQDLDALKMAVHARDVLEAAWIVGSLPEALVGVQRAIATTGEVHDIPLPLESPRQVLPWLLGPAAWAGDPTAEPQSVESTASAAPADFQAALIFGREDQGLTGQELHYAQRLLQIPSDRAYRSLNLAQAVAVCCYELGQAASERAHLPQTGLAQQSGVISVEAGAAIAPGPTDPTFGPSSLAVPEGPPAAEDQPASLAQLEGYFDQCQALLLEIGYLLPHTAESRMQRFRRLYYRAQPSDREVKMLRGILRQMRWALHNLPRSK